MAKVKVYASSTCVYCRKAKEFLKQNEVDYEEVDVMTEIGKHELEKLGFNVVPILLIDDQVIRGFNKVAIQEALHLDMTTP
ncbi:glutaredoxin family protein [Alicyclobacillus tolerans]|uniref:glutaredoxin family protein n=1 Tax=Alicyclobacillus tolerans TaxID=90970 RepID=UPI003B7A4758